MKITAITAVTAVAVAGCYGLEPSVSLYMEGEGLGNFNYNGMDHCVWTTWNNYWHAPFVLDTKETRGGSQSSNQPIGPCKKDKLE